MPQAGLVLEQEPASRLAGRCGADRAARCDVAVGEDVDAEATAVDEWSQQTRPLEPLEVRARLGQAQPTAVDVADEEVAADQGVHVDTAGQDLRRVLAKSRRASRVVRSSTTSMRRGRAAPSSCRRQAAQQLAPR
jgi:hypothetical protein